MKTLLLRMAGACQDPSLHSQKLPRRGRLRLEKPYLPQGKMAGNFFHSRQRADLSDFGCLGGRQMRFRAEIPDFPVSQMNHFCVGPGALLGFPGCSCPLRGSSWLLLAPSLAPGSCLLAPGSRHLAASELERGRIQTLIPRNCQGGDG